MEFRGSNTEKIRSQQSCLALCAEVVAGGDVRRYVPEFSEEAVPEPDSPGGRSNLGQLLLSRTTLGHNMPRMPRTPIV